MPFLSLFFELILNISETRLPGGEQKSHARDCRGRQKRRTVKCIGVPGRRRAGRPNRQGPLEAVSRLPGRKRGGLAGAKRGGLAGAKRGRPRVDQRRGRLRGRKKGEAAASPVRKVNSLYITELKILSRNKNLTANQNSYSKTLFTSHRLFKTSLHDLDDHILLLGSHLIV